MTEEIKHIHVKRSYFPTTVFKNKLIIPSPTTQRYIKSVLYENLYIRQKILYQEKKFNFNF